MKRQVKARLPRGFRDIFSDNYKLRLQMINTIREVYESYGFIPIETPAVEFVDVLGKFLPDSDQPDGGVFAFRVDDRWLALRYDLTAPLSRIVAMYKDLPKPLRRYQVGPVWRLEKPAPGRYREFYQFDIDIIGTDSMAADAEMCMILCDSLEALGFEPGTYIIKASNRKILNGIIDMSMQALSENEYIKQVLSWMAAKSKSKPSAELKKTEITPAIKLEHKLDIMRCIDKLDRVGLEGIQQLLEKGRKDETGDFKSGCFLSQKQIKPILEFLKIDCSNREKFLNSVSDLITEEHGKEGLDELKEMDEILSTAGYNDNRVIFDTQVVRGLTYYTGPVYEAFLTVKTTDEKGKSVQFGSVAGGGRYDDLIQRFTGQKIPATGTSIGIDRLLVAYQNIKKNELTSSTPVLVTVMDRPRLTDYQKMAQELRQAGISAELYLGKKGIGAQIKYADQRQIPVAVIAGEDEFNKGEVTLKDLRLGTRLSGEIADRDKWRKDQPAQIQVPRDKLVEGVKEILGRYR
ncbi:MAG: histidine--tRNA ligase [candidate division Zixibacteria bacterium 4484_95]|nr:MAG: histidine--tRNA ligase [candidate division Zixibacteria bacterium 4484_95]